MQLFYPFSVVKERASRCAVAGRGKSNDTLLKNIRKTFINASSSINEAEEAACLAVEIQRALPLGLGPVATSTLVCSSRTIYGF
jgi:hypothetical protein